MISARSRRSVAFFCMPEVGHFQRLRSLISGLTHNGILAYVFTHRKFGPQVERAGGVFFDLFSKYPLEQADSTSLPVPSRYVSFAATYAEQIRRDVEQTGPSLIVHDSFAVIGPVIAKLLGIPRVNVCAGHNVAPAHFLAILREDPRVQLSTECLRAADILRESYGMTDASPFSYVSSLSPHLNICCEPPEFLEESERPAFEPLAFYGSLPSLEEMQIGNQGDRQWFGPDSAHTFKVYISFGTVIWRYYAAEALRALNTLAETVAHLENTRAVISLGSTKISNDALAALLQPNVSVESNVDQWRLLQEADAFVTHHGMNSTHEAIFHRVPMISYPFFWDQPALAERCQKFGLAIPLTHSLRAEFGKDQVHAALRRLADERESILAALARAREWEIAVIARRATVLKRIEDLIQDL